MDQFLVLAHILADKVLPGSHHDLDIWYTSQELNSYVLSCLWIHTYNIIHGVTNHVIAPLAQVRTPSGDTCKGVFQLEPTVKNVSPPGLELGSFCEDLTRDQRTPSGEAQHRRIKAVKRGGIGLLGSSSA